MKPDSIPNASFRTFATGPMQFVVQEEDERDVGIGCGCGDDDLLRPCVEVELSLLARREEAGGLEHDLDAEFLPGEVGRVALVQEPKLDVPGADGSVERLYLLLEGAEDRVVLEQVGHRLRVAEIVDGDELDVRSPLSRGPGEVPSDPPETVDPHPYAHRSPPSWMPAGSLATGVRPLALEPTFVILASTASPLLRCRIQTPSGAQVQSAVKSEGEIVLGASPPTRSIPGENALAVSPEKLVPSLRSG